MTAAARAVLDRLGQIGEGQHHVVGLDVGQPERPDAGRIDDPAGALQRQRHRLRRRVPPLADAGDLADGAIRLGHKAIHQRGLPDAGVAEQHRHLVDQQRCHRRRAGRRGLRSRWSGRGRRTARRTVRRGARSDLVRHRIGVRPPAYAAIRARSTRPVRGGGSASATTISSWSALATTTRSVGSVSSAVRRNTVRRSPRRTMRARVSVRPDRSPTRPTSSPTTIGVRPSSRARMAVTRAVGVAAERTAPPPAIDRHHHALLGVGVVGPGLGPRPRAPTRPDPDVGLVVVPSAHDPAAIMPRASSTGLPACRPTSAGSPAGSWPWCRCPPPRRRAPAARRSHRPSPSGGRRRTATGRRAAAPR